MLLYKPYNKVANSWSDTRKELQELREENAELKDKIEDLTDYIKNGIQYDEALNRHVVVWTELQIKKAKKRAKEMADFFRSEQ